MSERRRSNSSHSQDERVMWMFKVGWYLSVDGKDGADGHEAVDVGGAVERIKTHNIFALEVKKMAEIILGFRCLKGFTPDKIPRGGRLEKLVRLDESASDSQIK